MASFKVNQTGVYYHTRDPNGPSGRHVRDLAKKARDLAKTTAPRDTGRLADSLGYRVRATGYGFKAQVGVFRPVAYPPRYTDGRGEGGQPRPNSARVLLMMTKGHPGPIRPKRAKKLRYGFDGAFRGSDGGPGREHFRNSVAGYDSDDFLIEACKHSWPYPVTEHPV